MSVKEKLEQEYHPQLLELEQVGNYKSLESRFSELEKILNSEPFVGIRKAVKKLDQPAYIVGGYVRDFLLQRPCKDIDFVIEGSGLDFAKESARSLHLPVKSVNTFANFGTAAFRYRDYELEFVGARKESYREDSRNPSVEAATIAEDQLRRDFTINALAIDLRENELGKIVDPFDGISDLQKGIIKTPTDPNITFSDDPLRMLRAIRFASQLNFNLTAEVFDAIKHNVERIRIISQERITTELNKILGSPKPSVGFKLLFKTGLLQEIFPEMAALHGVESINGKKHKDNFYHTLEVIDNICVETDNLWLRWSALLHDIAKPKTKRFHPKQGWTFHGHEDLGAKMVPKIFKRMRLPLDRKMKYVQKLVALHLRPIALTKEEATDSAIRRLLFDAGEDLEDLLTLCRADITSKNEGRVKRYLENYTKVERKLKTVEEKDRIRNMQPPISGEEIMEHFKIGPSREVGIIKNAIKDAILDGEITNEREEAWQFMIAKGKELGLESGK
ncbi:CCA tRNA nucleotidyltransferase [Luteibaculum oceani]|uniref:HD domain-containing protein n=1 Tax=Luteibaculum oceani TaxID=1294296 RepID=A0A5C6UY35_9FLAO|nr:HD domain-containing protein [Luteibaculum oceani]TXC76966.1 HD domain-containing protein [Luteibaculum oceani]